VRQRLDEDSQLDADRHLAVAAAKAGKDTRHALNLPGLGWGPGKPRTIGALW